MVEISHELSNSVDTNRLQKSVESNIIARPRAKLCIAWYQYSNYVCHDPSLCQSGWTYRRSYVFCRRIHGRSPRPHSWTIGVLLLKGWEGTGKEREGMGEGEKGRGGEGRGKEGEGEWAWGGTGHLPHGRLQTLAALLISICLSRTIRWNVRYKVNACVCVYLCRYNDKIARL